MKKNFQRNVYIGLLIVLSLLLSGCGGGEELPGGEDLPWYDEEEQTPEPEETEKRLSAFCLAFHRGETLDPVTCGEGVQQQIGGLLYEPLFALDEHFQPRPVLCERYDVLDEGMTYVFHIRPGVHFSDGSELTAADVAATLRRCLTSERYAARLSGVRSVTAQGADAVQIQLHWPHMALEALLDIPIVKAGTESSTVPAGTGPYLCITDGDAVCLRRNEDWWQKKPLPVEEIPLLDAKDADTVQYLFTSREVHAYAIDLAGSTAVLTGSFDCVDAPTPVMQYIGVNMAHPLLSDSAVRRCLSAAIDRETIASGYLSGHGSAADFPIAPQSSLYPHGFSKPYSPEESAAALRGALAGVEERQTLRLLVNEEGGEKVAIAQFIAQALSQGDLEVIVTALPWAEYMAALEAGDFDLYYGEVKLTADWDITPLVGTGGALNYGGYTDETMDFVLDGFRSSRYREVDVSGFCTVFARESPILPVAFGSVSLLTHRDTVSGVSPTAANIFSNFSDWTIPLRPVEESG